MRATRARSRGVRLVFPDFPLIDRCASNHTPRVVIFSVVITPDFERRPAGQLNMCVMYM
jgi:hypothetical protein